MRVLEVRWSRAPSLVCGVALRVLPLSLLARSYLGEVFLGYEREVDGTTTYM